MLQPDIVISGFSGRFPESDTVEEFKENLYNGVDMVTDDDRRWPRDLYRMPTRSGKLKNLEFFDATYFGIHPKLAHALDPQIRILLEVTYEAIIDAGINPINLRGSKTGVYIGSGTSELSEMWSTRPENVSSYELFSVMKSIFSNQISFCFDFKGPSLTVDTACSSSLYALHLAVQAIRAGECEAAIVGGVSIDIKPSNVLRLHNLNMLSPEGKCKAFDAEANGYVRSEAAVILFLQKSAEANRIYANIINTKTNADGYKYQGIIYPSGFMQNQLLKQIYEESGIDPNNLYYIEAHGTGTPVGDPEEVNAISQMFCRDRQDPLLIGSVKSNMGHSEGASGLCSIVKVLIAMETGVIPGNLHFKSPNSDILPIIEGRIKVIVEPTVWKGDITGVNSYGAGGSNAHVILKINPKINEHNKKINYRTGGIKKLLVVSGRTRRACEILLDSIRDTKNNDEFIGMIHNIFQHNIPGHDFRGYSILGDTHISEIENYQFTQQKKPIWFVFSGMGMHWPGMGKDLLEIEIFKMSVQHCADVLKPEGIDLMDLMLNNTKETLNNVINSFIIIISIQIGLIDVLASIGIKSDGMVGMSVGELACAYADGSLTLEQTILSAYWRGKVLTESELIPGGMAAVGLSWEETAQICPPDIQLAVHTAIDHVTVAGPAQSIEKFVEHLISMNVHATIIHSSGFAFHSKYIKDAAPKLRNILEKIIPISQVRSSTWLSSILPQNDWNTSKARFSSPEYFVNNLISPVNFYETIKLIPDNAITIDIAPHSALKTVIRKSLPNISTYIGLQNRDHSNNVEFLLCSIGKLHNTGVQPDVSKLYPSINFPVSRGTPMLNSLISWDHSTRWTVVDFYKKLNNIHESVIEIDISKEEHKYLIGHLIKGELLFPSSGYLFLVWETFAKIQKLNFEKLSITFKDVFFSRVTVIPKEGAIKFVVKILSNGNFEVCENRSSIVTGQITIQHGHEKYEKTVYKTNDFNKRTELNKNDFYKEMTLRGYDYSGIFQGVKSWNCFMKTGEVDWVNNWIAFMDTMLQIHAFQADTRNTLLPTRLQYVTIDPLKHLPNNVDRNCYTVNYYPRLQIINAGGVEMGGIKLSLAQKYQKSQPLLNLDTYKFETYDDNDKKKAVQDVLNSFISIIRENLVSLNLTAVELFSSENDLIGPLILNILKNQAIIRFDFQLAIPSNTDYEIKFEGIKTIKHDFAIRPVAKTVHFITANNVLSNKNSKILLNLVRTIKKNGYIMLIETGSIKISLVKDHGLVLVARQTVPGKSYLLLTKIENQNDSIIINVAEKKFKWLEKAKFALKQTRKVILVAQGETTSGIMGLAKSIQKESKAESKIQYFFIQDDTAPEFSITEPFYATQLEKNLFANVLRDKTWGRYQYLKINKTDLSNTVQMEHAYVDTLIKGNINSLTWIKNNLNYYKEESSAKKMYSVYYAPLNFRYVMLATGNLSADALPGNLVNEDCILGLEFVGRDSSGRRVMGLVPARGLATTVLVDPNDFVWEVPQKWTMEQAATIPLCYATSYYALIVRGKLQKGERVLIHSGAGGVGLASITIALKYGCSVFTTVGTDEKREFLKKRFPVLTDRHIANSRDTSFEKVVLEETRGRGVDVVLNSLARDKFKASLRCLAVKGRFLEIGQADLSSNNALGMEFFLKNTTFHGILLDDLCYSDSKEKQQVKQLVREGILNDDIKPLPATVFSDNRIEEGFNYMAVGEHIGKVIIKIRNEETEEITKPSVKTVAGISKMYLDPDKCYILVGGLGGFGLELTSWMISRGAKYIILTTRSGIKTGYQYMCVNRWKKNGTNVIISTRDVTTIEGTEKLLLESNEIAPIGGIFNLAGLLYSRLLDNLNIAHFELVSKPKFSATKNLDVLSRKYCPVLNFFVVMSSTAVVDPSPGQSNYALANSSMERLIEQRRAAGFPGLAIQWGPIGDVGMVHDVIGGSNETVFEGFIPQRIASCLDTMDLFLENDFGSIVSSRVLEEKITYAKANTHPNNLIQEIGDIIGIKDFQNVNSSTTFVNLGLDSLINSEIERTLYRNYNILLSFKEIRALTFAKLKEMSSGLNKESVVEEENLF